MKVATHFGAGNIGRAFIGEILQKNNFWINFVDTNEHIINELNRLDSYVIHYLNKDKTKLVVKNFSAINSNNKQKVIKSMLDSTIITISIGASNLKFLVNTFIEFIDIKHKNKDKKQVNIVCAENGIKVSSDFKKQILNVKPDLNLTNIGFVDAAVDKIVPEQHNESADVYGEEFYEFAVDKTQWLGDKLTGIDYYEDISPVLERKLFMLNGTHSLISWMGFGNYKYVNEFQDFPKIKQEVSEYINAVGEVISKKFSWNIEQIKEYAIKTMERFENRDIKDPIERTGRNVQRKIKNDERIVLPLVYAFEHHLNYLPMIKALLWAYKEKNFSDKEYLEVIDFVKQNGLEKAIQKFSSIDGQLLEKILKEK